MKNADIPILVFRKLADGAGRTLLEEVHDGQKTGVNRVVAPIPDSGGMWLALREDYSDSARPYAQLVLCATEACALDQEPATNDNEIAFLTFDRECDDPAAKRDESGVCTLEVRRELIRAREVGVGTPAFSALAKMVSEAERLAQEIHQS